MQFATVYYITLTAEQVASINSLGWDSPVGRVYLAAKAKGNYSFTENGLCAASLMKQAARLEATNNERVWMTLQNEPERWPDKRDERGEPIRCLTTQPRSMDVGDLIVWDDLTAFRCDSVGFSAFPRADWLAPVEA